ncbi:hypothetical protein [Spirulina sp. 06S082]|uniref:hypothetical protein n=1 Tax=Spirulina sp. 06S082 TaxID=3110248 RepID=UPI002B208257|nr:hypothetical protein [Spirulina sp. 06S082]MEA5470430.1 hypothetical protein [Spirulina sp. 06S082]
MKKLQQWILIEGVLGRASVLLAKTLDAIPDSISHNETKDEIKNAQDTIEHLRNAQTFNQITENAEYDSIIHALSQYDQPIPPSSGRKAVDKYLR